MARFLRIAPTPPFSLLIGVGGIGSGIAFELSGNHTLGRNESRPGRLLDLRDYCKLHIISHYVAVLLDSGSGSGQFRVLPIGKVGDDANGHRLIREMRAAGLDIQYVEVVPSQPTLFSVCFQYPDRSGGNITTSESAASLLTVADLESVAPVLEEAGQQAIVLAAPEVPLPIRVNLLEMGSRSGAFRAAALTSAEIHEVESQQILERTDLLAINQDEAGALINGTFSFTDSSRFLDRLVRHLQSYNPNIQIVLSAGAEGAFAFDSGWTTLPAHRVPVSSTAGAGDALFGGTIAGIIAGLRLPQAAELGVLLASFSVTSPHTIHPEAKVNRLLQFAEKYGIPVSPEILEVVRSTE